MDPSEIPLRDIHLPGADCLVAAGTRLVDRRRGRTRVMRRAVVVDTAAAAHDPHRSLIK